MTTRDPDLISMGDFVYLRDRPYLYRVTGVHNSPHARFYKLGNGTIWYRREDLRPATDPDRAVTR